MIDNIRPGELRPFGKNSRTHSSEQVKHIARSIQKFGFTNPVLTDGSYGIIAGHGRVLAAIELGMETVPTIALSHLSKKQIRAYVIADNKLALNAGWDDAILKEELTGILESGIDLDLTGFSLDEIDDLLGKESEPSDKDDDVPEIEQNVHNVKLGDLWKLGEHRLLCGDSTDKVQVDRLMDGEKADMVFTDPPYGIGYKPVDINGWKKSEVRTISGDENTVIAKNAYKILPKCTQIIFGGNYFTDFLPCNGAWIVWNKLGFDKPNQNFSHCELAWTNKNINAVHMISHVWDGAFREGDRKTEAKTRLHPNQKPVSLIVKLLDNENIFDPFLGSGSTLIACEKTNRKCYGMEIDPHYCSVIIERWQKFTESKAELCDG